MSSSKASSVKVMSNSASSVNRDIEASDLTPLIHNASVADDRITLVCCRMPRAYACILFVIAMVTGQVGQNVALPLFINSLGEIANPYFVVLMLSFVFAVVFGLITLILKLTTNYIGEVERNFSHLFMFCIGVMSGLSGIMIVFASDPTRTLPFLQAILGNSVIPFTFIATFFILRKKTTLKQAASAGLVLLGLAVCLYPTFTQDTSQSGVSTFQRVFWPMVFMFGFAPAAIMNVVEELVLKKETLEHLKDEMGRVNLFFLLFWTSTYQFIIVAALFWAAVVPGFGVMETTSIAKLGDSLLVNLDCFLNINGSNCPRAFGNGAIFAGCYVGVYIASGFLLRHASAKYLVVANTLITPLGALWWTLFRIPNNFEPLAFDAHWDFQTTCAAIAMPVMVVGVAWYHYMEAQEHAMEAQVKAGGDGPQRTRSRGRGGSYDDDSSKRLLAFPSAEPQAVASVKKYEF